MVQDKITEKKYYTVTLEALAPVTFTYKILAASPEEALYSLDRISPIERKIISNNLGCKKITAKVYLWGTNLMQLLKRF